MSQGLPEDVVKFLLESPEELQRVRYRMMDVEEQRTRPARIAAELERRSKLPLEKCRGNGYGCGNMTPGGYECPSCVQEFRDDPDAFK